MTDEKPARLDARPASDLPNIARAAAEALIRRLMSARGWPRHESNGWDLSWVGGPWGPDDTPGWIRVMCSPPHAPPGWTLFDELDRFSRWLAALGYRLDRVSMIEPMHFRLVPGTVDPQIGTEKT